MKENQHKLISAVEKVPQLHKSDTLKKTDRTDPAWLLTLTEGRFVKLINETIRFLKTYRYLPSESDAVSFIIEVSKYLQLVSSNPEMFGFNTSESDTEKNV